MTYLNLSRIQTSSTPLTRIQLNQSITPFILVCYCQNITLGPTLLSLRLLQEEIKTIFEIETSSYEILPIIDTLPKQSQHHHHHHHHKIHDILSFKFSKDFISHLTHFMSQLTNAVQKIEHVCEFSLKNSPNSTFGDSLHYINDLTHFKRLFEQTKRIVLRLIECVNGENIMNSRVLEFYTFLNEYHTLDCRSNFFEAFQLLVDSSSKLCDKIAEASLKSQEKITFDTLNLELFYNPCSILKRVLFEKYMTAKKQLEKDSKSNSPTSMSPITSMSPTPKNVDMKEKFYLLEVI